MSFRLKQLFTVLFALVLAGVLVACGAEEDDGDAILDPVETPLVEEEEPLEEEPLEEELQEPLEEETAEVEEEAQEQPPLGHEEVFGEGEIDYLEADEQLLQGDAITQTMITSDEFIGLDLVTADDVHLGEVVEVYFDIDGNIPYIVFDIEEEGVVEIETLLGRDLFVEEVDTVLVSTNLLNITAAAGEEMADVDVQTPYRLMLLEDFGEDIPLWASSWTWTTRTRLQSRGLRSHSRLRTITSWWRPTPPRWKARRPSMMNWKTVCLTKVWSTTSTLTGIKKLNVATVS